jgi:epsilon-lactone hydrolase
MTLPSSEHEGVVALLRQVRAESQETPTVEVARQRLDASGDLFAIPEGVTVEPFSIDTLSCERYDPPAARSTPIILYCHGGAYVGGSLRSHRSLCARIAVATEASVVAVDYRLAPEHPFPAALDDAMKAYRWLLSSGYEAEHVVLAGDSAGGGLAAATLLSLQANDATPAGAVLLSPWLDLTLTNEAVVAVGSSDPMLVASILQRDAEMYNGDDLRSPLVSPYFASDESLAALPPMLILAGTRDILVGDGRDFAERALAQGAKVSLELGEGLIHVWPFLSGVPEATAAMTLIGDWVGQL